MNGSEEGCDFGVRALQLEGSFDPGISKIGGRKAPRRLPD